MNTVTKCYLQDEHQQYYELMVGFALEDHVPHVLAEVICEYIEESQIERFLRCLRSRTPLVFRRMEE